MVNKRRKSRVPRSIQEALIRQFVAETTFLSGEIELDESYFGGQPSQGQTRTRCRREKDRLRPAQAKRQGSCPDRARHENINAGADYPRDRQAGEHCLYRGINKQLNS